MLPNPDVDAFLAKLKGTRRAGDGWIARCPAHDDDRASLSVSMGRDGRLLANCHAGCEFVDILRAAGIDRASSGVSSPPPPPRATRWTTTYTYEDESGVPLYRVLRGEPKDFRPQHPDGNGGWSWGLHGRRRVLYRLPAILEAKAAGRGIVFVEGEKDAEALAERGVVATTIAGGASAPLPPDIADSLAGADLVLLPDNDDAGRALVDRVARAAHGRAKSVRIVALPGLPAKGDVSDWLAAGGTRAELNRLIGAAAPYEPTDPTPLELPAEADEDVGEPSSLTPVLDPAALHGPLGSIVRLIAPHTEAHPAGILVTLLAGVGAMLGRQYRQVIGGADHHGNLFALLTGPSSDGRKGTAVSEARRVLRLIDPDFMQQNVAGGLSSGEGLIYKVRDADPVNTKKGAEPPSAPVTRDKRLLVFEEEMGGPFVRMKKEGNSLSAVLRQAWDGCTLSTLTKGDGGLVSTEPHISVIAQTTVDELKHCLHGIELSNGFLNRFLVVYVERVRSVPFETRANDERVASIAGALRGTLGRLPQREVDLEQDAAALWGGGLYAELTEGMAGQLGALTRRGAPIVRRVAMLYALCDGQATISAAHLRAAHALWRYSRDSLRLVYGEHPLHEDTDRLLKAVGDSGPRGVGLTELRERAGAKKWDRARWQKHIDELTRSGLVRSSSVETDGRPRTVLRLTRFALAATAASTTGERSEVGEGSPEIVDRGNSEIGERSEERTPLNTRTDLSSPNSLISYFPHENEGGEEVVTGGGDGWTTLEL